MNSCPFELDSFLGARRGFSEGGYAESALAPLLPVALRTQQSDFVTRVRVRPTVAGTFFISTTRLPHTTDF